MNARTAVSDAIQAAPADPAYEGQIVVTVARGDRADGVAVPEIELIVRDNGAALPDEIRAHMFDPLGGLTDVIVGRRLGLGTITALVLRLGGSMRTEQLVSGGTAVVVTLPASESE